MLANYRECQVLRSNFRCLGLIVLKFPKPSDCTLGIGEFWSLTHDEAVHIMDVPADEAKAGG